MARVWGLFIGLSVLLASAVASESIVLSDPTKPDNYVDQADQQGASQPILQSIIIQGSSAHAVIDGQRVAVGDPVRTYRVARIDKDSVQLMGEGQQLTLRLFAVGIKEEKR